MKEQRRACRLSTLEVWMLLRDPKKLKTLMLLRDVKHRELAQAVGWMRWDEREGKWVGNHSMVGRLLKGDRRSVTTERAALIAEFFGVAIDDLFMIKVDSKTVRPVAQDGNRAA